MTPEQRRAYQRAWRASNLEHCRAYARKYYLAAYHADHDANVQKQRDRRAADPARARAYANAWNARHPDRMRANNHRRRAVGAVDAHVLAAVVFAADTICAYCLQRKSLTLEHVQPISRDGTNAVSNLVMACKSCNTRKRDKTPLEYIFGLPKLGLPLKPPTTHKVTHTIMSNPFQAQAQATPVQSATVQPASGGGLDNPALYSGHNTPLLPNTLDGRWKLQIISVSGHTGYESGPAVHITFKILESTQTATKAGECYRLFYRFNYTTMQPVEGKQGTVHAGLLGKFVAALFNRNYTDPAFSKTDALAAICTNARGGAGHDFAASPGFVELYGELRDNRNPKAPVPGAPPQPAPAGKLRSDIWLPFNATATA